MSLILIYVVVIGAAFMFMTSRGRKKQQAQAQAMQQALVPGAEVRTIGGLVGTVIEMTDEYVVIETTPGVRLKFTKQAVAGVVQPEGAAALGEQSAEAEQEAAESEPTDAVPAEAETEAELEPEPESATEEAEDPQKVG